MQKNVLVFFGGKSVEHDISIITGLQTIGVIRAEQEKKNNLLPYNFVPVYMSREGGWFIGEKLTNLDFLKAFSSSDKGIQRVTLVSGEPMLAKQTFKKYRPFLKVDMAILCNHGKGGEDGSLQGVLEMCGIPQTSCGVLGSSVCMDKIMTKSVLKANGFNQTESVWFTRHEWQTSKESILEKIAPLGYPVVVKPSNLGSSIGISICKDIESVKNAIDIADKFDSRILVEKAVLNLREFNCSVIGNSFSCTASDIEEPISWEKFLSFEAKYLSNGKLAGMGSSKREYPAKISDELALKIKEESKRAFKVLACKGVVRVDFLFNSETEELFLNEVNTIPGSLSNYFWEKYGTSFAELLSKIIFFAEDEFLNDKKNSIDFVSKALESFGSIKGTMKNTHTK